MTESVALGRDAGGVDDGTLAGHLAAIASMHDAALAHIASLAEPWLRPTSMAGHASPATDQIAIASSQPRVRHEGAAAA